MGAASFIQAILLQSVQNPASSNLWSCSLCRTIHSCSVHGRCRRPHGQRRLISSRRYLPRAPRSRGCQSVDSHGRRSCGPRRSVLGHCRSSRCCSDLFRISSTMVRRSLPIFGFSLLLANMDANGNGYITAAEIAGQMAKMGYPLTYRELSDMMQEADTNGDGVISLKAAAVGGGVGQICIGGWLAAKAAAVGGGESGFDPSR